MNFSTTITNNNPNTLVYLSAPQINNLCCVICEIDSIEAKDSSAKSRFHWQTMKCRLLVHVIPEVIASPVKGAEGYIFIIAEKEYFASGKLHLALKNLKLLFVSLRPLTTEVYKICLAHTIRCKVAPSWIQLGQYLVEGKELYKSAQGAGAIKLDVLINDESVCLQLEAGKVKMQHVKLEDFSIPQMRIADFLADPKGYLNLANRVATNVHVLPSMKKGKVLSVSKQIPERCPFKDYNQLRRHWKNMYGYILPKNSHGILYYEIKFPVPHTDAFIYPEICLTLQSVELSKTWDTKSTIKQFISAVQKTIPYICGKRLQTFDEKFLNMKTPNNHVTYPTRLSLASCTDTHLPAPSVDSGYKSEVILNSSTSNAAKVMPQNRQIDRTTTVNLLLTRLTKIQEIHDAAVTVPAIANRTVTSQIHGLNIKTISKVSKRKSVITNEESISSYFQAKKVCPNTNSKENREVDNTMQKNLSLKEKLANAKDATSNTKC